jgi:hypothetical protein
MAQHQLLFLSLFLFQFYLPSKDVKQNNIKVVINDKNLSFSLCLSLSPVCCSVWLSLSLSLSLSPLSKGSTNATTHVDVNVTVIAVLCGQRRSCCGFFFFFFCLKGQDFIKGWLQRQQNKRRQCLMS